MIKNFSKFVNETREFSSRHGEKTPVFTFFERMPEIGLVELSIVYSDDEVEYIGIADPSKYSKSEIMEIEDYIEENSYDIVREIIAANRKRGVGYTNPGEYGNSSRGY